MFIENELNFLDKKWSINSMTGMGHAKVGEGDLIVECMIKSVNHRGLDVKLGLSSELRHLEPLVSLDLSKKLSRGRIEIRMSTGSNSPVSKPSFDEKRARVLISKLNDFYESLGDESILPLSMGDLLSLPGVMAQPESIMPEQLEIIAGRALSLAIDDLQASRIKEGEALAVILRSMIKKSHSFISRIGQERDRDIMVRFQKLKARCDELFSGYNLSQERIYQESALLAERSDFTEEIDRCAAHLRFFSEICEGQGLKGRKLDFLCQEMLREVSTLLSKAFDHGIQIMGIELKAEVEKIREQVQNIE